MVRAHLDADDWHLSRLAVVPDLRGSGVGRWMLSLAEDARPSAAARLVLRTGARSADNLRLYTAAGYEVLTTGTDEIKLAKLVEPWLRPTPAEAGPYEDIVPVTAGPPRARSMSG